MIKLADLSRQRAVLPAYSLLRTTCFDKRNKLKSEKPYPPKYPLRFLRWYCREDYLEEIEGDLTEVFIRQAETSPRKAKWKFVLGVILHIRPQFLNIPPVMKSILSIKENPFVLLLFTTIVLLFALAFRPVANTDFQDKTMFAIPLDSVVWIIPLLLLSTWLLYLLINKFLYSRTITWVHTLTTVITTFLIVVVLYISINPTHYTNAKHELIGSVMQILFLLFVFGQLSFIANVLMGFFGRSKTKSVK